MKKIKRIELLQVREKITRQKSVSRLDSINADTKKCHDISNEIKALVNNSAANNESLNSQLYKNERILTQKMMDQKEIMTNRIEFLEGEKKILIEELNKSEFKEKVFKKYKEKFKNDYLRKKQIKMDDEIYSIKRS